MQNGSMNRAIINTQFVLPPHNLFAFVGTKIMYINIHFLKFTELENTSKKTKGVDSLNKWANRAPAVEIFASFSRQPYTLCPQKPKEFSNVGN